MKLEGPTNESFNHFGVDPAQQRIFRCRDSPNSKESPQKVYEILQFINSLLLEAGDVRAFPGLDGSNLLLKA